MKVIGVGNEWRTDDGVGPEIARRLRGIVVGGEPIGLVEAFSGEQVTLVDAVVSGAPAGTIHRYDATKTPLPSEVFGGTSTHALGLAEAVEIARALRRLPKRVLVYGIEAGDLGYGRGLTPPVEAAAALVAAELRGA